MTRRAVVLAGAGALLLVGTGVATAAVDSESGSPKGDLPPPDGERTDQTAKPDLPVGGATQPGLPPPVDR